MKPSQSLSGIDRICLTVPRQEDTAKHIIDLNLGPIISHKVTFNQFALNTKGARHGRLTLELLQTLDIHG